LGAQSLGGADLGLDACRDRGCDFVLEREEVLQIAIVPLCPEMLAAFRFHPLRGNANPLPDLADTALEQVFRAERQADAAYVGTRALEREAGIAGDDDDRPVL